MTEQLSFLDSQYSEQALVDHSPAVSVSSIFSASSPSKLSECDLQPIRASAADGPAAHNEFGTPGRLGPKAEAGRTNVFDETCKFVQRNGMPPFAQLLSFSVSLARRSNVNALSYDEATMVGTKIANYIAVHHDPKLARPAPVRPGRVRAAEKERILLLHRSSIAQGTPLSVRDLAKALGVSKTKVQNTIEAAGLCPKRQIKLATLTATARAVVTIIDRLFSSQGKRAIEFINLSTAVGAFSDAEISDLKSAIREVDTAGVNIRILVTDIAHPNTGSPIVALSRGRRLDDKRLEEWLKDLLRHQADKKRLGLPKRVVLEVNGRIFHHPMARDFSCVLRIRNGSRDLDTWRDYITASTGGGEPARDILQFVAFDMPKIVSIAANYARLSDADPEKILGRLHNWVAEPLDHDTAEHVFSMASHLMESDMSDAECLEWWAEQSQYLERIPFLGNRDPLDFFEIVSQDDDEDDASIWKAVSRMEEFYFPPETMIVTGAGPSSNVSTVPTPGSTNQHADFDIDEDTHDLNWDIDGYLLDPEEEASAALGFYRDEPADPLPSIANLVVEEEIPM